MAADELVAARRPAPKRIRQDDRGGAAIDIAFHTTLILGTAAVAAFFIRAIRSSVVDSSPQPAAEPAVPTA